MSHSDNNTLPRNERGFWRQRINPFHGQSKPLSDRIAGQLNELHSHLSINAAHFKKGIQDRMSDLGGEDAAQCHKPIERLLNRLHVLEEYSFWPVPQHHSATLRESIQGYRSDAAQIVSACQNLLAALAGKEIQSEALTQFTEKLQGCRNCFERYRKQIDGLYWQLEGSNNTQAR